MNAQTLVATAIDSSGRVLCTLSGSDLKGLMLRVDAAHPNCWGATIRGESTSDGTYHGPGKGRVLASREPRRINGSFFSGWLIE